jgi:hypothetical protein
VARPKAVQHGSEVVPVEAFLVIADVYCIAVRRFDGDSRDFARVNPAIACTEVLIFARFQDDRSLDTHGNNSEL